MLPHNDFNDGQSFAHENYVLELEMSVYVTIYVHCLLLSLCQGKDLLSGFLDWSCDPLSCVCP